MAGRLVMFSDFDAIQNSYHSFEQWMHEERPRLKRPLTLSEKLLLSHLDPSSRNRDPKRGEEWIELRVDRVALQDVTAQMALLQFMLARIERVAVPTTVHCDHLIQAEIGAKEDLLRAKDESKEVYDFLSSASLHYGITFWPPGSGIIHQVVLENYAFPGALMIGSDSHTPNAGGLGQLAIGVGGGDAVDSMAGMPWELKMPKLLGVRLIGKLQPWVSAKDIILKVASELTVKGGTGFIIEYLGPGARTLSCTGKATICNMGAEVGATCSLFPYDEKMESYLRATKRSNVADRANTLRDYLQADLEVENNPKAYFDQLLEIDLDQLTPYVNGPYSPDLAWPIAELAKAVHERNYPDTISVALIGSCTNSSYEDIERAVSLARQGAAHGLHCKCPLTITPGSEQIYETIKRDGHLAILEKIGATVLANACGPCIGQWKRHDVKLGERNTIMTSFNRNFSGRNDANPGTHSFVASPEMVIAFALSGKLSFNPLSDMLDSPSGPFRLEAPQGKELPEKGFAFPLHRPENASAMTKIEVAIDPSSERLAKLTPFPAWQGSDYKNLSILLKAKGKCTTDHISPAGKWLRFRGHLDRISDNLFANASNSFRELNGQGLNNLTGEIESFSKVARSYLAAKIGWIAIGDENYGEGSSREHAAMEPRHLGGLAIIAKSFARIHETNLKKQGMLALTFAKSSDYDRIQESDRADLIGLTELAPLSLVTLRLYHTDGEQELIPLKHTLNEGQIAWFRAGSALNLIAQSIDPSDKYRF